MTVDLSLTLLKSSAADTFIIEDGGGGGGGGVLPTGACEYGMDGRYRNSAGRSLCGTLRFTVLVSELRPVTDPGLPQAHR